jgi:hypothetical protein
VRKTTPRTQTAPAQTNALRASARAVNPIVSCHDTLVMTTRAIEKIMHLQSTANGRPIKFTHERIEQIRNLVERGMTPEQIAETIGTTPGSLAVTCSRLGLSLRRRKSAPAKDKVIVINNGNKTPPLPTPTPAPESQFTLRLKIDYGNQTRSTVIPLDQDALIKLILEANMRDLSLTDFVADLISTIAERDLRQQ